MAPEYFEDSEKSQLKFGKEGDIWSLGVMFFEILTKDFKKPLYIECFKNEKSFHEMIKEEIQLIGFPDEISTLIVQMLKRKPTERPDTKEILKILVSENDEKQNVIEEEKVELEENLEVINLSKIGNSPISRYGHSMCIYSNSVYM